MGSVGLRLHRFCGSSVSWRPTLTDRTAASIHCPGSRARRFFSPAGPQAFGGVHQTAIALASAAVSLSA